MAVWSIAAAVAAAGLFSLGTAAQHKAAAHSLVIRGGTGEGKRALGAILRHPLWLLGLAADGVGFGLHAFALAVGELALVQPLMVTSLVFTLIITAVLERRPVSRTEWGLGLLITASLMGFLVVTRPNTSAVTFPELWPAVGAAGGSMLLVLLLLAAGRRLRGHRATVLGIVTGLFFGANTALVKAVGGLFSGSISGVFISWPLYALLVVGPAGFVINQMAFQAGPLSASLPATLVVDTLSSIGFGVLLFDENFRGGGWRSLGQGCALLVLTVAVIRLARFEASSQRTADGSVADEAVHDPEYCLPTEADSMATARPHA